MIRIYELEKFRKVDVKYEKIKPINFETSSIQEIITYYSESAMWELFQNSSIENLIRNINNKHPSTYRNSIKKLS